MAGARQSKASHRRERESRESRQQERITLISIGVLVAVAIIAATGVVWGIVLPPRATVLTVGSESFSASDATSRAIFATKAVVENAETSALLKRDGLTASPQQHALRGIGAEMAVYEIP